MSPHSLTKIFRLTVRDCMGPKPVEVARAATVGEALSRMAQADSVAAIVSGSDGKPVGIITEQDVVRRIALRAGREQPVETVMTEPVVTVSANDHLLQAVTAMRRQNLRYIPAVGDTGSLAGFLRLDEALIILSGLAARIMDVFTQAATIEGLRRAKEAEVALADDLIEGETPTDEVLAVVTEINSELHRRALDLAIADMRADGWGEPPVPFALVVMGSIGRGESLLAPDQDNAFILADYPDAEHARMDAYFVPLAERFTRDLDAIGFPLCIGNVMASNPVWRKRLSEWREQIALWLRKRTETQLLLSDILVDFRHVWGETILSEKLRAYTTEGLSRNRTFIRDLFAIEPDEAAALGWFGRLRSERDRQDHPGMINLKLRGTLPLVQAARILSLGAGITATSTLARLEGLRGKGILHLDDYTDLKDAFRFISYLLLRQQIEDFEAGRPMDDFIPEARLTKREKDHLVASLRAIVNMRSTLRAELTGNVF